MYTTTKSYDFSEVYGDLPLDEVPEEVDLDDVARRAFQAIRNLQEGDLADNVIWRDWLSLSGRTQTFCGVEEVFGQWRRSISRKRLEKVELKTQNILKPCKGSSWVSIGMVFNTVQDNGLTGYHTANIGLVPTSAGWKIRIISTILETFEGYGHPDEPQLAPAIRAPLVRDDLDYSVVIIGGGQSGISLAGRLKAINIPALVIEKGEQVGHAWISKYDSVKQHTTREYNNLPFDRTWKAEDASYLPAKVVADGFVRYVENYNIEVWTTSQPTSCIRDDYSQTWTIKVLTQPMHGEPQFRTIKAKHLAIATGAGLGLPKPPQMQGRERFKGTIMHQNGFRNAKGLSGKRAIVIGTGTTGHDIAQDCFDNGMYVTMIQRSKTAVFPVEWQGYDAFWNRDVPTTVSDRMGLSGPLKFTCEMVRRSDQQQMINPHWQQHFAGLEKAGFQVDYDSTLIEMIYQRYGGYYIDIGTSKHIIDGDIKIKSGVPIKTLTETGILFEDGEELSADLIVTATGYESDYRKHVALIVGDEMAGGLPEFWGLTKNGDVRGWMDEARPGLWMLGGAAPQARFNTRFIALKMMLDLIGVENVVS